MASSTPQYLVEPAPFEPAPFEQPRAADAGKAFAALDHAHQQLVACEVAELVAIAHAADLYRVDSEAVGEGLERLIRPGRDGTPLVVEFLAMEIGALLGISPGAALERVGDTLDLRHRHPGLWTAVLGGGVRVWQAVRVCRQARHLSAAAAAQLDNRIAHALAQLPWGQVCGRYPAGCGRQLRNPRRAVRNATTQPGRRVPLRHPGVPAAVTPTTPTPTPRAPRRRPGWTTSAHCPGSPTEPKPTGTGP